MRRNQWFGVLLVLVLLFASACSDDDPTPIALTPDVTAAPDTDDVEPDPGETTGEPDQPASDSGSRWG